MYKVDEKKIVITDRQFLRILPKLDWGSTCNVYKIRVGYDMYALKVFNGLQRVTEEECERMQEINIDSYISPLKLLYISGRFKGYSMRLCAGKDLYQRSLDISVEEFAKNTVKLMEDTHKLSLCKYNIYDSYITNGMYDNGFRMIDMDDYVYEPNKSLDEIETLNNIRLNLFLKDVFVKNANIAFIEDDSIKDLLKKSDAGEITFEEVFNIICTRAYNIADEKLSTISDVGKVLRKNQKK